MNLARCFSCIPGKVADAVNIKLICEWANKTIPIPPLRWVPEIETAFWIDAGGPHAPADLPTFLATADIPTVQVLTINTKGITLIEGLQNLPALGILQVNSNALTNLDVSNMTNLTSVSCENNLIGQAGGTLTTTGCTSLTSLYCSNNSLLGLFVEHLTNLQILECHDNALFTLSCQNMLALQRLICHDNAIGNAGGVLLVSGSTAITEIQCQHNFITDLNCSGLTLLDTLDCSFNQLGQINLTDCFGLITFDWSNNPGVTIIGP